MLEEYQEIHNERYENIFIHDREQEYSLYCGKCGATRHRLAKNKYCCGRKMNDANMEEQHEW